MTVKSLTELSGTHVVKASEDEGRTWFFARASFSPQSRLNFAYLNRALGANGVHHASKVTEEDVRKGRYQIAIAEPCEHEGLRFSYE